MTSAAPQRLPNFVIVGGARCGTSALATFLHRHPDIYMSPQKEPSFFLFDGAPPAFTGPGDDYLTTMVRTTWHDYLALFAGARHERAVGEASVYYLYRPDALRRLTSELPDVRVIAILRDPVERAFSAWAHHVRDGREELGFLDAVEAGERRRQAGWEWAWSYCELSRYHHHVRELQHLLDPDRLLLLRHDEFERDGPAVLSRVFRFLGVDPGVSIDTSTRVNPGGRPRNARLHAVLHEPHPVKDLLRPLVPDRIRQHTHRALLVRNTERLSLDPTVRSSLLDHFVDDVRALEGTTGWDLAAWRS